MGVRQMEARDVATVLAIIAAAPEAAGWGREAFEKFLTEPARGSCWVAEEQEQLAGFVCFRVLGNEAELLNLAVLPGARRQGVGSRLLEAALDKAAEAGATKMFLEVRDTNGEALRLYERWGFRRCGRRVGYYTNPPADALLLVRYLKSAAEESPQTPAERR
ncbi:MAG: ribosomal protein S18-alanine N-acetyltransferase [Acidobacteria bacterium]|nr:ribosomal protein S18-alanine N-acetyltransferase [Acidobacteriota bacterium]